MADLIARYPWNDHPLGAIERWPQSLKTAVSLILNSRHPMWIGWGEQMAFLYNDAYLHVLGLAKHPWALGRPASEVWAEIWDVCGPLADKVFRNGEASFVDDVRLFMNRGDFLEETFYSFSYSPIRGESGEVAGLFCPSNDVTAKVVGARRLGTLSELVANALVQKSTEAACASAAATLAKNSDDIPFALIYLADGDGCTLENAVGVSAGDPLAPHSAGPHASPDGLGARVVAALRDGRSERFSLRDVPDTPVGPAERRVVDAALFPIAGRAGTGALGVLVVGVNPTRPLDDEYAAFFELVSSNIGTAIKNARAAEEEKKRIELLAEMDRAKTAFFSNVSHEFRTPLTLMLGPLDQLTRGDDQRARALAQTARRNALRLLKLVNTLLEFSRLEAGRNDALFARTDLGTLTRDVASGFRSAIESAGLRFTIETQLDEPAYVDRSMWERIVLNLLSNALKFTFEGGITVRLRREADFAELAVTDTGVGIAAEEIPRLFQRFHRVRGAKSRTHEGSGIGLALVQDLAALHGGSVDAESTLGEGTTFRVRLPLGTAHLDPAKVVSDEGTTYSSAVEQYLADIEATVMRGGASFEAAQPANGTRPRVLLADDNADLREYVGAILAGRYDVSAVGNGREALEAARAGNFDLIVSDVMMPEMDGFELLRAVRADERIATVPFVMLSARAGEESALEGFREGADDYIVKPFSAEELLARVYSQINATAIRERATQQLRASEERFRTLASSLPYVVLEADATGAVTFLSDEYAAYTGQPAERGYGSGWTWLIHRDDASDVVRAWGAACSAGETFSAEFRLRRKDGAYRWFVARILPQRGGEGGVVRWIGTLTDVHEQRQAAKERDFLARASQILGEPLALDTTLKAIARLTIPDVADWCQIRLRTEDGRIRTVASAHRDPEKDRLAQQFVGRVHLNMHSEYGSGYVFRTGCSQLLAEVSSDVIDSSVGDEHEAAVYRALGVRSAVVIPLSAEGETLGMLAVNYGSSQRHYSADDVPMLEELGRRAGIAIHKARAFEREHRAAESFQEASLPAALPEAPGLVLDAFYAPGRAEAQVGGDWYDALRLIDGRVVVSIGDVAGSGLDAAVTMGNMRQIIRGIAQVHADPSLMLDAADRALRLEHPDTFVTAFVGVFDPITGAFTYASAGHPPPLLRHPDGRIDALDGSGLPLGLRSNAEQARSRTVALPVGARLVLYTDGLTELDRAPADGERRLRAVVAAAEHDGAGAARAIVQRMTEQGAARDDVALLVVDVRSAAGLDGTGRESLQRWTFRTDDADSVSTARRAFARAFREHGAALEDVAMAEIVFGELTGNVVRYAGGPGEVIVDWSGPEPVLHVLDAGPGFRHIAILPPDLMSESGRGLFIVSALTEDFRVSKRADGGSHARAVLRMKRRQLVNVHDAPFSGSLLHALADRVGIVDA